MSTVEVISLLKRTPTEHQGLCKRHQVFFGVVALGLQRVRQAAFEIERPREGLPCCDKAGSPSAAPSWQTMFKTFGEGSGRAAAVGAGRCSHAPANADPINHAHPSRQRLRLRSTSGRFWPRLSVHRKTTRSSPLCIASSSAHMDAAHDDCAPAAMRISAIAGPFDRNEERRRGTSPGLDFAFGSAPSLSFAMSRCGSTWRRQPTSVLRKSKSPPKQFYRQTAELRPITSRCCRKTRAVSSSASSSWSDSRQDASPSFRRLPSLSIAAGYRGRARKAALLCHWRTGRALRV